MPSGPSLLARHYHCTLRVHVLLQYILWSSSSPYIGTLGLVYRLFKYMDPQGYFSNRSQHRDRAPPPVEVEFVLRFSRGASLSTLLKFAMEPWTHHGCGHQLERLVPGTRQHPSL